MPNTTTLLPSGTFQQADYRKKKFGVTERKKTELDALALKVLDAQQEVDQFTAVVASLTDKLTTFQMFLNTADTNRVQALNHKNTVEQLVNNVKDLIQNSRIAFEEITQADESVGKVAKEIRIVVQRLIYTTELLNKLSNIVIRRKALNPLISDELVSRLAKAGSDANNAVALSIVALNSSFTAQASNIESKGATALEVKQSIALQQLLTGTQPLSDELFSIGNAQNDLVSTNVAQPAAAAAAPANTSAITPVEPLQQLLTTAYYRAKNKYEHAQDAFIRATNQLNQAKASLSKAQVKLKSLQAGLAAANAAAFS